MKRWLLPNFIIDLSDLWTHDEGPRIIGNEEILSRKCWKAFRERTNNNQVGFWDLTETTSVATVQSWEKKAIELRAQFDGAVILGIGGSYLGAAAIIDALRAPEDSEKFPIYPIAQPDPETMERIRCISSVKRLATVVISKSGNTVETLAAFYFLSHWLDPSGYVVITDPHSGELRQLAQRERWSCFDVPPNVGGRFSVLTAVGLFPALLANISASSILAGAKRLREALTQSASQECPAFWMALSHYRWDTQCLRKAHYLMAYREKLTYLTAWYVQLFAESLNKRVAQRAVGFMPVAALGPSDQHSLLQMFKDGPADKVVGILDVKSASKTVVGSPRFTLTGESAYLCGVTFERLIHASAIATEKTLKNSRVPTFRLIVDAVRPEALGSVFLFFEMVCALAGELYGLDAYNQPGVEEGKRILKESLLGDGGIG